MAGTQSLPAWLSYSASVITDTDGALTTSTTVLYLPLTYYGPSIPLNSDWTYGGLTSPASTSSAPTLTEPPSASPSATSISATPFPSISSSPNPSSAIPPSASSTSPFSTSTQSSSNPSSTNASSTVAPSSSITSFPISAHTANRNIGIIVGSVFGFLALFVVVGLLFCWRFKRNRRSSGSRFSMVTPIDQDYMVVDSRAPGEGSPRGSGEEADSFLQRSRLADAAGVHGSSSQAAAAAAAARPRPVSDTLSSGSSATSYGQVLETPTISGSNTHLTQPQTYHNSAPPIAEPKYGPILSSKELQMIGEEEDTESNHSLLPPPRLNPDQFGGYSSPRPTVTWRKPSERSFGSQRSSFPLDADEAATLFTARRVKAEELDPRTPPKLSVSIPPENPVAGPSSWIGGLGQNIKRFSWLNRPNPSRPSSFIARAMSDPEQEAGRALLSPEMAETARTRSTILSGERPISSVSARSGTSGGTVYHDAHSSLSGPGTPLQGTPPLTPLPRALTPTAYGQSHSRSGSRAATPPQVPPPYYDEYPEQPVGVALSRTLPSMPVVDILDTPVPPPISPFTAASSLRAEGSESAGTSTPPFPPGLGELPNPAVWHATDGVTPSLGSHDGDDAGITIDVLEEAPPAAGAGWRSLAGVVGPTLGNRGQRTTFGLPQYVYPHNATASEQGSLHSMRSHLTPNSMSVRSTGSAPASSIHALSGSVGSGSSRSAARSASSGHSLAPSRSISSDGRRGRHPSHDSHDSGLGPFSPAVSAFGRATSPQQRSPLHRHPEVADTASAATGTTIDTTTGTLRTTASGATEPASSGSPVLHFPSLPWAGGLDGDWNPM